jgi:NodT family efflux transporter outer membrane factor (OMF) lipoprotein
VRSRARSPSLLFMGRDRTRSVQGGEVCRLNGCVGFRRHFPTLTASPSVPPHKGEGGKAWALALALTLGACAVGPRYAPPQTPTAAQGAFVSTGPAGADRPVPPLWWRLYQDPVLDRLVQQALTENQSLKVAAANLAYAQALLDEARAGRYPSTSLTAGPQYGRSSTSLLTGAPAAWAYTAGFTASYQVDLFGRIRRTIGQASASVEATRAAEDVARVTVAAATAGAYANICGLGEQLDVANRSLAVVQQTYDITVRQRDAGGLSDFDVARQGVLLEQARAAIAPLDGQRRSALFALAALIGKTPAEVPAEAGGCRVPPRLGRPLPVGDGAALLRRRPDIRQAERTVAANTAGIGVATANLYPTVTLGGSVASSAGQLGQMFAYPTTSYSVGPLITWTFPNITVSLAQIAQARAQTSAAIATFDGTILQALQETEQALATLATELDHNRALVAARTNADEALRLAQIQYQAGTASGLDQLTAEATKIAADQAVAASDQAIATDQVAVFQALGGGWEDAPVVAAPKVGG